MSLIFSGFEETKLKIYSKKLNKSSKAILLLRLENKKWEISYIDKKPCEKVHICFYLIIVEF